MNEVVATVVPETLLTATSILPSPLKSAIASPIAEELLDWSTGKLAVAAKLGGAAPPGAVVLSKTPSADLPPEIVATTRSGMPSALTSATAIGPPPCAPRSNDAAALNAGTGPVPPTPIKDTENCLSGLTPD